MHDAGYRVSNVDVTVIAQKPKLLPYLEAMRANLAAALGVDAERGQRQRQDERRRGQHGPRRVNGLPRGRADRGLKVLRS